jgi:hypothetical protein
MHQQCPCGNGCDVALARRLTYTAMDGSVRVVDWIAYQCGQEVADETQQEQPLRRDNDAGRLVRHHINERARAGAV